MAANGVSLREISRLTAAGSATGADVERGDRSSICASSLPATRRDSFAAGASRGGMIASAGAEAASGESAISTAAPLCSQPVQTRPTSRLTVATTAVGAVAKRDTSLCRAVRTRTISRSKLLQAIAAIPSDRSTRRCCRSARSVASRTAVTTATRLLANGTGSAAAIASDSSSVTRDDGDASCGGDSGVARGAAGGAAAPAASVSWPDACAVACSDCCNSWRITSFDVFRTASAKAEAARRLAGLAARSKRGCPAAYHRPRPLSSTTLSVSCTSSPGW